MNVTWIIETNTKYFAINLYANVSGLAFYGGLVYLIGYWHSNNIFKLLCEQMHLLHVYEGSADEAEVVNHVFKCHSFWSYIL